MAQIRSKQIADFLTTVNWAEVTNSKIANASDVKAYVDQEVEALGLDANASIDSLETALSAEIVATNADVDGLNEAIDALGAKHDAEMEAHHTEHTSLIEAEAVARANGDTELAELIRAEEERAGNEEGRLAAAISVEEDRIDAILLASDADKDSFAEIVALINAVDTENDQDVVNVIAALNAEIDATNSDFVRVEGALAAEIAATNGDVDGLNEAIVSLEAKHNEEMEAHHVEHTSLITAEETRALAAEKLLEEALANEIADTNSDVTSIDLRLGEVSGDLVDSVDSLEVALSAEIVATNSDVTRLEGALSDEEAAREDADDALQAALTDLDNKFSAEVVSHHNEHTSLINDEFERATNVEGKLSAEIVTEKDRIDAILLAADADKDSFAEIVALIGEIDTENDDALATFKLNVNASVDSLESALTAEINATNSDVTALYAAITAEEAAREDADDALQAALAAEIADTNADVIRIDNKDAEQDGRLDVLESTILEDNEMYVESFLGLGFEYTLEKDVQDGNKFLVTAFVNGHNVTVESVSGNVVRFANPGYVIDKGDVVTITYQA